MHKSILMKLNLAVDDDDDIADGAHRSRRGSSPRSRALRLNSLGYNTLAIWIIAAPYKVIISKVHISSPEKWADGSSKRNGWSKKVHI